MLRLFLLLTIATDTAALKENPITPILATVLRLFVNKSCLSLNLFQNVGLQLNGMLEFVQPSETTVYNQNNLRVELTPPLKIILERRPVIYDYLPEAVGLPEYVHAAILLEKAA